MLELAHRTVFFGHGRAGARVCASGETPPEGSRVALCDVSVSIAVGERVAVIGPNGAGKTTLLRELASAAGAGEDGVPRCVFVPSHDVSPPALTVRDYVMLGRTPRLSAWRRPAPADDAAVDSAIASVGAAALAGRRMDALSSGELRRASIAFALATGAPALLLDEPTAHVDAAGRVAFFDLLRRIGRTIVMTIHEFPLPRGFFTRAVLLRAGRIVADGGPAEVMSRYLDDTTQEV
jgi:iron complex transport system ATP-binding protein